MQSITTLEDDKLTTISRLADGGQTSRSYSFFDAGMLLVCAIYILFSWSSLYLCAEILASSDYGGYQFMDTENISCKKWKIKFYNTMGAEKVPVPQFTRRGFQMCVWDFDGWSRLFC